MKTKGLIVFLIFFAACTAKQSPSLELPPGGIVVQDSMERSVVLKESPQSVVVLSASLAEIWLLAGGSLTGTTDDAFDRGLDISPEQTQIIGSIKDPNAEMILMLEPDLVILTDDIPGHQALLPILTKADIPCYIAKVETFDDYLFVLEEFTRITGQEQNFVVYGETVKSRINELLDRLPQTNGTPISYLFLRAHSGGVKAIARDHVVCDILKDAGAVNIAESNDTLLSDLSMEAILKEDPQFIFVITMGADTEKALQSLKTSLSGQPAWGQLTAVKEDRVIILPKDLYHYKPNQHWDKAYAYLLEILYPEND